VRNLRGLTDETEISKGASSTRSVAPSASIANLVPAYAWWEGTLCARATLYNHPLLQPYCGPILQPESGLRRPLRWPSLTFGIGRGDLSHPRRHTEMPGALIRPATLVLRLERYAHLCKVCAYGARTAWGSIQNRVDATRGASLARPKAGLGVVLLSLHGGAADHARFDRSEKSTFRSLSGPLAADEDGERTSDFSKPAALRGLDIAFGLTFTTPQGRTVARCSQRGAERPSRN
jgi:hypothetical protein